MIKVLIVDDHTVFRQSMSIMLAGIDGLCVVGDAATGEDALKLIETESPHVVLMDVRMPGIGGLEATRRMLEMNGDLRIIGLSGYNDGAYPGRFMQAGALGYITKESDVEEIQQAIRNVSQGEVYLSPAVAKRIANQNGAWTNPDETSDDLPDTTQGDTPFDELAERELQVALLIAECYNLADITHRLNISERSVRSYRARAFKKLGVKSDVELTLLALRCGMVEPENINRLD